MNAVDYTTMAGIIGSEWKKEKAKCKTKADEERVSNLHECTMILLRLAHEKMMDEMDTLLTDMGQPATFDGNGEPV